MQMKRRISRPAEEALNLARYNWRSIGYKTSGSSGFTSGRGDNQQGGISHFRPYEGVSCESDGSCNGCESCENCG